MYMYVDRINSQSGFLVGVKAHLTITIISVVIHPTNTPLSVLQADLVVSTLLTWAIAHARLEVPFTTHCTQNTVLLQ